MNLQTFVKMCRGVNNFPFHADSFLWKVDLINIYIMLAMANNRRRAKESDHIPDDGKLFMYKQLLRDRLLYTALHYKLGYDVQKKCA